MAHVVKRTSACCDLVGKHEGKGRVGRLRHRCERICIKTNFQEIQWEGVERLIWLRIGSGGKFFFFVN